VEEKSSKRQNSKNKWLEDGEDEGDGTGVKAGIFFPRLE
jgi:hypothetical protein